MGKVQTCRPTPSRCGVNKNALASILQGAGSERAAPASAAAAAANIAGKEKWLTWHILYSRNCSSHSGSVVKGNLLEPFHGTMARRSCILSIEDKAWSWLMDAGESIRQMGSQFI